MNKFILYITIFFILPTSLFAAFSGGDGTATSPYWISSKADIEALADSVNNGSYWSQNKHFLLTNDITDTVSVLIGTNALYYITSFMGHFNGNQKNIVKNTAPLFRIVASDGIIENLNLSGEIILDYMNSGAGIVSRNLGLIQNCKNYSSITSLGLGQVGGITIYSAAYADTSSTGIINCTNYGDLKNGYYIGGIVTINGNRILNCINAGNISATDRAGGITSISASSSISNNWQIPVAISLIKDCINLGTIESDIDAGGITAWTSTHTGYTSHLINNANYGFVKGNNNAGGIVARLVTANDPKEKIIGNFNSGVVSGNGNVGCIIGWKANIGATVENNHYDKQMCGEPEPSELGE